MDSNTNASHWRTTILAASASYLDAGSIVAGAVGLSLWAEHFRVGTHFVGLIGALSSNAISAGVGALIGGWLCDRLGRRVIFQWDLLLYAFGLLWIIFAVAPWMLIVGYVFVGLAVGIDVPASWTLIAESAPRGAHGRHGAVAQLMWVAGPIVVLVLALALSGAGVLGVRIVFAHLLLVAIVVWALRRRLVESPMWSDETAAGQVPRASFRRLLTGPYLVPLAMITAIYGLWNLNAGTNGFYLPYILRTVGSQTQAWSVGIGVVTFVLGGLSGVLIFMRRVDRGNRRLMFASACALQIGAILLLATLPLTRPVAIAYVVLTGVGSGIGQQPFFQLWSAEAFPTMLRATALGLMFAIVRIALGLWSFFVPTLTRTGFHTLAWILTSFLVASSIIGLIYGRRAARRSSPGLLQRDDHVELPRAVYALDALELDVGRR